MSPVPSPSDLAERVQRRRNRVLWVFLIFFIWQGVYFNSRILADGPLRTVDLVSLAGHVVLAIVLLMLLATGGGWRHGKAVRSLLDDEATRAHRAQAYAAGFWALTLCALGLYATAPFVQMKLGEAAHILLSVAVAVPAMRFVMLEQRAERG